MLSGTAAIGIEKADLLALSTGKTVPLNSLRNWKAARARVLSGAGNATVLCVGDSRTFGSMSLGTTFTNNLRSKSYPAQLAGILTAKGLTANWSSWIGGGGSTDWANQDTRLAIGSWVNQGIGTLGSNVLNATAAATLSFTPLNTVDTVVPLAINTGAPTFTVSVDAGATLATITPNAMAHISGTYGKGNPVALGSVASHAIKYNWASGTPYIAGMIAYNSNIPEVSVLNAGWYGSVVANWISGSWFPTDGIKAIAPDLTIIALTTNDIIGATSVATYTANMQTLITAAKASGDVLIVIDGPVSGSSVASRAAYTAALYALATTNNCAVLDLPAVWGEYATFSGYYISTDNLHETKTGYAAKAHLIAEMLLS